MEIKRWLGLRNTVAPENMKPGALDVAVDVDVDDAGSIRTREGRTLLAAGASHSLFAAGDVALVMQGADLKRMDWVGALTQLRRLSHAGPVAYAELNGTVYLTNGTDTARVVHGAAREWGVRNPVGQPAAQASWGNMPAGKYQYAMTFLRSDGLESGTPVPGVIDLLMGGGIALSQLPVSSDSEVTHRVLYLSGPGGAELYRHHNVAVEYATQGVFETRLGAVLDPDLIEPAPPGQLVEIHAGAAYVADGSVVWVSDQYSLERFRRRHRFLQLPGHVTLVGSVNDGLYVSTDKGTWFLAGNDPTSLKLTQVSTAGATIGTMVRFDATELAEEDEEKSGVALVGLLWVGGEGVTMGLPGGGVKVLTEGDYSLPEAARGAGVLRSARGYSSYISTLQGVSAPNKY